MTEQELDRAALEQAKRHMGDFAWPTVLLGVVAVGLFFATPFLVKAAMIPFWAGGLMMAVLTYAAYTALHESVHGSISGARQDLRWVNEAVGYLAGLVVGIPLTAHRHLHLAHHRHTNEPASDPDYMIKDLCRSPAGAVRVAIAAMVHNYRYYLGERWSQARGTQNRTFCLEIVSAVALRLLVVMFTDPGVTLALFLLASVGGLLLLVFLFAYLVHYPYEATGRYVDTATIIAPAPINSLVTWAWLFQNYHAIHHLFPRVPFYKYRSLFDAIEPIMLARGAPVLHLTGKGLTRQKQLVEVAG